MPTSRRRFLEVVGVTAASSAMACGSKKVTGPLSGGNVKSVPVGHLGFLDGPVALGRDAGGLYAMTAICTHQQCEMQSDGHIEASGLVCDCHGSRFDKTGTVIGGPAGQSLEHYRVDLAGDGSITVQVGTAVAASVRTKVP